MTLLFTVIEVGKLLPRSFANPFHFECRMCAWQDCYWRVQA